MLPLPVLVVATVSIGIGRPHRSLVDLRQSYYEAHYAIKIRKLKGGRGVLASFDDLGSYGLLLGLISNTHRSLEVFRSHFELDGLIAAAVASSEHGYNKPHPSIFRTALKLLSVEPGEAVMVGDSVKADIEGARQVGMRAVLVRRSGAGLSSPLQHTLGPGYEDVPVVGSLAELPALLLSEPRTPVPESRLPKPESRTPNPESRS